jgi:hypothetical protein
MIVEKPVLRYDVANKMWACCFAGFTFFDSNPDQAFNTCMGYIRDLYYA